MEGNMKGGTNSASFISSNVCSACSKKPNTILLLNSLSSSSSSISRICSNVKASMLSPKSGKLTEPASLCSGEKKVSAVVSFLYMLLLVGGGAWGYVKGGGSGFWRGSVPYPRNLWLMLW